MAVDYNEFVAQTTNRQTILNILRAREREPMHFTSFSVVRGTLRGQANAELGASIAADTIQDTFKTIGKSVTPASGGGSREETVEDTNIVNDNATSYSPKIALQVTTGTDFDIAVNATDEFYKGILGPLKDTLVVHFLRQGFPADLLSHLVIGEMRFLVSFKSNGHDINSSGLVAQDNDERYGSRVVDIVQNNPDEQDSASAFSMNMNCRVLSYIPRTRDRRTVSFTDMSAISSVSDDLFNRTRQNHPVIDRYSIDIEGKTDFGLALSSPKRCTMVRQHLTELGVSHVNALARTLGLSSNNALIASNYRNSQNYIAGNTPLPSRKIGRQSDSDDIVASRNSVEDTSYQFVAKNFFGKLLQERGISAGYTGDLIIEITLRSVEGVLYYLGEYIREPQVRPMLYGSPCEAPSDELDNDNVISGSQEATTSSPEIRASTATPDMASAPKASPNMPCVPILVVKRRSEVKGEILAEVPYRSVTYAVPLSGRKLNSEAGRSSQTISLVQQLLNLHRSSKDLPVTPLVRVAN